MDVNRITDNFAAAGQIAPEDVKEIARQGYKVIVNNRPDYEGGPEQPTSEAVRAAAAAEGLEYHYIPMTPDRLSPELIEEFRQAIENGPGPVFAHCKSGARSTALWALVECCHNARDVDQVIAQAAQQGYDLSQMRPLFQAYTERLRG